MNASWVWLFVLACVVAWVIVLGLLTYGMASIGEPQSAWLWCEIIGTCPGGEG